MNPAPAHLEAKLRFFDLTVGQIAAALSGLLVGVFWAEYLCPLHGLVRAITGAYLGGLPIAVVYVASQTEFDLWLFARSALRWRRQDGRYHPGAGTTASGYLVEAEPSTTGRPAIESLDLSALWDQPTTAIPERLDGQP